MLGARQSGQCRVAGQVLAWKGVYQAGSVEVPTHPSFRVRYPGGISRRMWVSHLRFGDLDVQAGRKP